MSVGAARNSSNSLTRQENPTMTTIVDSQTIYADCTVSTSHTTGIVDNIVEMPPPSSTPLSTASGIEWGVMLSDTDVSNGFVKDGSSLPYVFEANESGTRKRNTKILPVCGMCGKKFVCVTTMKRHLVTHTGEKPFSCKVCGKQYTQKGNLRVHERTHRNDRPFQCNICTQKFYRKEPMQKHQWRQHGIVHVKSRPTGSATPNNNSPALNINVNDNNDGNSNNNSTHRIIGAEGMLYKALTASVMDGSNGGISQQQPSSSTTVHTEESLSVANTEDLMTIHQQQPIQHDQQQQLATTEYQIVEANLEDFHQAQFTDSVGFLDSPVAYIVQSTEEEVQYASIEVYTEGAVTGNYQETYILNTHDVQGLASESVEIQQEVKEEETPLVEASEVEHDNSAQRPVKLKMKLAQAYLKEIEENRELENLNESLGGGRDTHERLECNISSIRLSSTPEENTHDTQQPLQIEQASLESIVANLTMPVQSTSTTEAPVKADTQTTADHPDTLEFLCKSCGSRCQVSDPYSFRCGTCNMKYTSLPTHLIAEPLQCIGCVQIFPHKPALKLHQSSGVKERPFKCCKCGFEFRQKAHMQKHQWRIHRKKYDTTEPANKETEQVTPSTPTVNEQAESVIAEATKIANEAIKKLVSDQESSPLDLSPAKMYGTTGSISNWVQQVETARTPMKPDVTIHKKPAEDMSTFKDILARPPVNQEQVQLQIINPLNGGKEESLTLHLVSKNSAPAVSSQMPIYAVKSRPVNVEESHSISLQSRDLETNPLLNQVIDSPFSAPEPVSIMPISVSCPRSPKRARTDITVASSHISIPTEISFRETPACQQPADLSINSHTYDLKTPLAVRTVPLRLDAPYSTVSPPLNLSSHSTTPSPQVSPYDYRVTKSAGISGHFQRLKSQDERSGI